jgi:ubiquinone/menaquinone biosynthesis C-methylase UbiE
VALTNPDFRAQSYEIWQRMAAGWDSDRRWMWETTEALGEWLVDALDPQPGQTILELAAGVGETGYLAALRIGQEGKLISTDFAPNMVEAAQAESQRLGLENVDHRQLDAEDMDLADESVDGVLCRWGYMLMSDPAGAFLETRRVLREGGAVSFSVFAEPERNPWASIPGKLLAELTGGSAPAPTTPGILAMGDPERTRSLLEASGFEVQRMEELPLTWRFDDFDAYWRFLNELAGALSAKIAALTDEERGLFRARLEESVDPYRTQRGYEVPAVTQNTLAT